MSKTPHNIIEGEVFWRKWYIKFNQCRNKTTKTAFCIKNKLNYDRFQYWFHKFKKSIDKPQELIPVTLSTMEHEVGTIELDNGHRIIIHDRQFLLEYLLRLS